MNHVRTFFFATFGERVGIRSVELQIPPQASVAAFKSLLLEKILVLSGTTSHMLISVNEEYVLDEAIIPDGVEIALFPTVSGE
jgi:molybdopterin converting factor small subunit